MKETTKKRNAEMLKRYNEGYSLSEVAAMYDMDYDITSKILRVEKARVSISKKGSKNGIKN